ncbi:MAG: GNAT family N-acetyltransferase [Chloroflexi bacterium]|nr:GNAT family N-acetyltransferase [Chloroflexota bacterium]
MTSDRPTSDAGPAIRRAHPSEAGALSELALRSKGHWGYDEDFLAACRDDLARSPDDIATSVVYVHDEGDAVLGYYRVLLQDDAVAELDALFVEPTAMCQGLGKRLWRHAITTATALGCTEIVLQSDPQAEGFYLAMGAERAGESQSTVMPGRMLPLMRFRLR